MAYPDSGHVQYLANQWLSTVIRLFRAEPEASLHLYGCHLTVVSLGVILTRGGHPVRVRHSTVFQSILKSVMSGQSDASGVVELL